MGTLVVTYSIAWASVGAYAAWLVIGNRRLRRRLGGLEADSTGEPPRIGRDERAA